ncbi:MAG: phosphatase PAP2 family protein [Candidatus Berkiella sp.]
MYFLDFIAKGGLAFCHTPIVASILILGLFTQKREIFIRTAYLLLFTMVYNVLLKSIWQNPLPPPLEGWAFPSGHMHSAMIFWGWLAIEFKKIWFSEIVFLILTLVGYGLIQQGYHYPIDVFASIGFGAISLMLYTFINRLSFFKGRTDRLGWLMLTLSGLIFVSMIPEARKPHVIKAISILSIFVISWTTVQFFSKQKKGS